MVAADDVQYFRVVVGPGLGKHWCFSLIIFVQQSYFMSFTGHSWDRPGSVPGDVVPSSCCSWSDCHPYIFGYCLLGKSQHTQIRKYYQIPNAAIINIEPLLFCTSHWLTDTKWIFSCCPMWGSLINMSYNVVISRLSTVPYFSVAIWRVVVVDHWVHHASVLVSEGKQKPLHLGG